MDKKQKAKYKQLLKENWMKQEILSLAKYEKDNNGYAAWRIDNCIDKDSEAGKRGMAHIVVPFKLADKSSRNSKEDLYQSFLYDYVLGNIKKELI